MKEATKIKQVPVESIKPYERNPRKNDNAVDALANSIKEFGFKVPIIVDKSNMIVAGHTRYKAAKKLGMAKVPVIVADDLTPKQVKAFRLVDNKVAELSEWDYDILPDEIQGIDFNMVDFGFPDFFAGNASIEEDATSEYGGTNNPAPEIRQGIFDNGRGGLPEELKGVQLEPTPFERIEGDGKTLMERVIIVYPKEREQEVAQLLGLESITKVLYTLDEIKK